MRQRWIGWGLGGLLLLAGAGCQRVPVPTVGTVERLEVHLRVRPTGDLEVRETATLAPSGTTLRFAHVIQSPTTDRLDWTTASIDDVPVEPGREGLRVAGGGTDPLDVVLEREGTAPTTFGLTYVATSAVAVRRLRGELSWPILPAGRGFDVGQVLVTLDVPDGVAIYGGTGMAEAGWDVEVSTGRVIARRDRVGADEAATLLAVFDIDRTQVRQGEWEWNRDRQAEYGLALIAAGIFLLVVAAGILIQLRVQYPPPLDAATRQMLSRGLWLSAVVTLLVAVGLEVVAVRWLSGLGRALEFIPLCFAVAAAMFAVAGWRYGRGGRQA